VAVFACSRWITARARSVFARATRSPFSRPIRTGTRPASSRSCGPSARPSSFRLTTRRST
jgi:hypothetical protein